VIDSILKLPQSTGLLNHAHPIPSSLSSALHDFNLAALFLHRGITPHMYVSNMCQSCLKRTAYLCLAKQQSSTNIIAALRTGAVHLQWAIILELSWLHTLTKAINRGVVLTVIVGASWKDNSELCNL